MAIETSPAFQFYVKEWRSSRSVQRMSFAERGIYLEMLCEQWENVTLPDDAVAVADIIATTPEQVDQVIAAWPAIRRKFVMHETLAGRIYNIRLQAVRSGLRRFQKIAKKGGKARADQAARSSAGTFQPGVQPPSSRESSGRPADTPAAIQPTVQPPTSTASAFATASKNEDARVRDGSAPERVTDAFRAHWKRTYSVESTVILNPLQFMDLERQLDKCGESKLLAAMTAFFATDDPYVRKARHPLTLFLREPTKYLAKDAPVRSASILTAEETREAQRRLREQAS